MLHRILVACAAAAVLGNAPGVLAQSNNEHFSFKVVNQPTTGLKEDRLTAVIERWSTDQERDMLLEAIEQKDHARVQLLLSQQPGVGYVHWPGGLHYNLRYAKRMTRPDGGSELILATDSRVWVWWDGKVDLPKDAQYSVFRIRLDENGVGEGTVAAPTEVKADKMAGFLVADPAPRATLLTDFRKASTAQDRTN
ncbi:MAG: hypothetical protein AB7O32_13200 [Vicinamibacterales bacterium]